MHYSRVTWVLVCALAGACDKVVDVAPDAGPACDDNIKNGSESDVDCGGSCEPCAVAKTCAAGDDCASGICNGTCAAPSCSDGVKNGDELDVDCAGACGAGSCKTGQTCDDSAQCVSQLCAGTNVCIAPKRVFLTAASFTGAQMGGLTGADAKCQAEADAAQLGGTYKAWLSDSTGSPSTRFTKSVAPYVRTDGMQLASDWDDLIDGNIAAPINRNAANQAANGAANVCGATLVYVFTNTSNAGTPGPAGNSCTNWTSNSGPSAWGRIDQLVFWTSNCSGGTDGCSMPTPIYCFEQ